MRYILVFAMAALIGLPMVFVSCGAETAGKAISYNAAIVGSTEVGGSTRDFTNRRGWKVTLSSAWVIVGPVYFYDGEARASLWQRLLGSGVVYACPTHAQFDFGVVLGQILEQYAVDLLSTTPTLIGEIGGVEGHCRSLELHLHPPGRVQAGGSAELMQKLDGATIKMAGEASKDGDKVAFSAKLTIPERGTMRIVDSITADVALKNKTEKQGVLLLQVLLDVWFANVDFATNAQQDPNQAILLDEDTIALLQGVRSRYAYRAVWSTSQ